MAFQDVVLAIGCVRGVGWVIGFILRHLLLLVRTGHKRGENIKGEEEEKRKKKKKEKENFFLKSVRNSNKFIEIDSPLQSPVIISPWNLVL